MLGKPKFKVGDRIKFDLDKNCESIEGTILIVDRWGVFEDDSDVHYDIEAIMPDWVEYGIPGEPCLFKHVKEVFVHELE